MALSNYAELKQSIINWSHRDDIDLLVDDFISLGETEIYQNGEEPLRVRSMETRATALADTASRYLALPDGYIQMRRLRLEINSNSNDVKYQTPEEMRIIQGGGLPTFFTVTSQVEFNKTPDAAYTVEMQYHKKLTLLDSGNTTNAILTQYPTIYLFSALWALFEYTEEEQLAQKYYIRMINAIKGANKQDRKGRYGSVPAARIEGATP